MNTQPDLVAAETLRRQAHQHLAAGQLKQAAGVLQALLADRPEDVPAAVDLARILGRTGRWRDSVAPLLAAMDHLPRHAPLLLTLARELLARGEVLAARRCLDFLAGAPELPGALLRAASDLRFLTGEYASARELLERALAGGVDDPETHFRHALFCYVAGELDAARKILEATLERWPGHGDAIVLLTTLGADLPHQAWLVRVEDMLQTLGSTRAVDHVEYQRAEFEYARYRLLEDLDRSNEAWDALQAGNRRMHALRAYDPAAGTALVEAMLRGAERLPPALPQTATDGPVPIFIVGMPRSGSTLLSQMLSAHSQVVNAGELPDLLRLLRRVTNVPPERPDGLAQAVADLSADALAELTRLYLEQTRWRAGDRPFYIDKTPANALLVPFIHRALPQARILHIEREPMDACFSNYKAMFGNRAAYSYDLGSVAHHCREHSRLMQAWRQQFPGAMLDVSYAALVREPRATLEAVLEYCGLAFEEACLHPEANVGQVATPSGAQVREPVHAKALGQWRRYATQLEPLRKALGELAPAD